MNDGPATILIVLAFILVPAFIYILIYTVRCPHNPFRRLTRTAADPSKDPDIHKERKDFVSTVKYKQKESPENETGTECSVCLSAFVDGEEISQINDCKHMFHVKCIDMWLRSHSTCPICRTSLPVKRCRRHPVNDDDDIRQGLPDATSLV